MSAAVGSLVRRGFEMGAAQLQKAPEQKYQIPTWGLIVLGITVLFFAVVSTMLEYTFLHLIPTLLMVESPEAIVFEPLTVEDPNAPTTKKPSDPELLLVEQRPITSSFRETIKHLQGKGGFRARFRGISIFVVTNFLIQGITAMLTIFLPFFIAPIIANVVSANLLLAWNHIVISDPSPKSWYRRVPSLRVWKKVAGPTAILAVANQLAIVLPAHLAAIFGFFGSPQEINTSGAVGILLLKGFFMLAIILAFTFAIVMPADVVLTRVQASLLPDEVESVVPFDRSFGGKVVPELVGGSGVIGMLEAWRTFDWNSRVRLLKTYAKALAMQLALSMFCLVIIVAEVALIVGKDYNKILPGGEQNGKDAIFV